MQQSFTREFMENNCGCYTQDMLDACSFMKDEVFLTDIVKSEIPLRDKYWFVCKKVASKKQNQKIAIAVAEIVLPIYEKRHNDTRPREAIEAAKQFIAGHITLEQLRTKRAAAHAAAAHAAAAHAAAAHAHAAAHAAHAAAAAAHAADAAHAAAHAAAAAAHAAADAAAHAAAAAYAADLKQQLLDYLVNFINERIITV